MADPTLSGPMSGLDAIKRIRAEYEDVILAFSTGKDSLACWLTIREHFNVIPHYQYSIPGLEFVDEALDYYERFFSTKIIRLPHPRLHRLLNNLVFQTPERMLVIDQAGLPNHDYADIRQVLIEDNKLDPGTFVADGVRAADSPLRRIALSKYGPITWESRRFHPIWDMKKAQVLELFRKSGVKLTTDYKLFGRTFDGLDARFLVPLKQHRPRDYQRVLDWFPLAELEVYRWENWDAK